MMTWAEDGDHLERGVRTKKVRARRRAKAHENLVLTPGLTLPYPMTGFEFRKVRKATGMNQAEFGKRIGRCLATVASYELGRTVIPPDIHTIVSKIAIEASYRLAGLEPPVETPPPRKPLHKRLLEWLFPKIG